MIAAVRVLHGIRLAALAATLLLVACSGETIDGTTSQAPRKGESTTGEATSTDDDEASHSATAPRADTTKTPEGVVSSAPGSPTAGTGVAAVAQKIKFACASDTDSVTASYWLALLRAPDAGGLQTWLGVIQSGQSRLDVLHQIIQSPEFESKHAGLSDEDFVIGLYDTFLDRAPDAAGKAGWLSQLAAGASRASIAIAFSDSSEFHDPSGRATACYF